MLDPSPETYRSLLSLRTVRKFRPEPLDDADLTAILEAGRWTGSAKNRQAWRFVVITDRQQMNRLADCGDFSVPMRNAAAVVAPVRLPDGYDWDMGRVAQNMMLAAAAIGVGSCPVTLHDEECSRRVLGLPEGHRCHVTVVLGYPDEEAEERGRAARPIAGGRLPLEDLVRRERFE